MDLFDYMRETKMESEAPLASRIRPRTLDEIVGQQHILAKDKLLYRAIKADKLSSVIFYGPPGTGKTTIAKVIAGTTSAAFTQINATVAGKKDMEEVVAEAKQRMGMYGKRTILFVDEIHRFNKGQQDYLLPFVEDGTLVLIGATTENPYFEVNGALLSRSKVFELKPLEKEDIKKLILRAVTDSERGMGAYDVCMDEEAVDFLADAADGDARSALNAVELGVLTTERSADGKIHFTIDVASEFLSLAACCLLGLLPGCSFPMTDNMQVEDLLRAPRLSGDYGALQSALNDWLGESAQLKYPMQGELLSPFLLQDLDGDGEQDAAVLYTTAQSSNVCIAFLQKDAAGAWKVQQTIEGLADTVDNVRLAQLQDGNAVQLVVGYLAAQGDSYLAVYSYEHGEVNAILEQSYEQYLVEDITGGGNEDLILMSTLEDGGVQIELLTVNRDGSFQQVAVMGLSADKFSGCASVASGLGADGRHYLVLDGWTGISGNNLATVLLRFDEESQQMIPAEQISASALYSASLRNVSNLVSRDLDGDGTVEIPTQPDEAGLLNMSQSRRMDFIVWMDYTRPDPEKSFGLLDEETNCYIELPAEWEGNLLLTDSADIDDAVELRTVDENKLVLTLRLVSSSASAAGWTRLGVVASRQMQAKLGEDAVIQDQTYRLSRSLYRLN